jgi:hypothetical protein
MGVLEVFREAAPVPFQDGRIRDEQKYLSP